MLKKLDKLVVNGQPHFGQFAGVDDINFLDADVTNPAGKPLSQAQKKRKANQFIFISLHHERFVIGVAMVNLKLISNAFIYVYDKDNQTLVENSVLNPAGIFTTMPTTPNQGRYHFTGLSASGITTLNIQMADNVLTLHVNNHVCHIDCNITLSQNPMCLCTRTGYTGWVYTQKQTALACEGTLRLKTTPRKTSLKTTTFKKQTKQTHTLNAQNCLASMDWTLGYMTRETFWNWANINGRLNGNKLFGLNLVCGVNDTSYTENACWVNDKLYQLPLIVFDYQKTDIMQPWHIYSDGQDKLTDKSCSVDLYFQPQAVRSEHKDIKLLASHFSQLIGTFTGEIRLADEILSLDHIWGLTEDHYAKW